MPVRFVQRYTRAMAQAEPDVLFVFGDNMKRTGLAPHGVGPRDMLAVKRGVRGGR